MQEKYRMLFLMFGLVLMLVAIQLLMHGLSDWEGNALHRWGALVVSLIAEGMLVAIYKPSSGVVKFVILCVSIVPLFAIFSLALPILSPSGTGM